MLWRYGLLKTGCTIGSLSVSCTCICFVRGWQVATSDCLESEEPNWPVLVSRTVIAMASIDKSELFIPDDSLSFFFQMWMYYRLFYSIFCKSLPMSSPRRADSLL